MSNDSAARGNILQLLKQLCILNYKELEQFSGIFDSISGQTNTDIVDVAPSSNCVALKQMLDSIQIILCPISGSV